MYHTCLEMMFMQPCLFENPFSFSLQCDKAAKNGWPVDTAGGCVRKCSNDLWRSRQGILAYLKLSEFIEFSCEMLCKWWAHLDHEKKYDRL